MRQLEFLFTEDGARQRYLEHQLADMRAKWLQQPDPKPNIRLYRVKYVEDGYAKCFSDTWKEYYFGGYLVEKETETAKKAFENNNLYK